MKVHADMRTGSRNHGATFKPLISKRVGRSPKTPKRPFSQSVVCSSANSGEQSGSFRFRQACRAFSKPNKIDLMRCFARLRV